MCRPAGWFESASMEPARGCPSSPLTLQHGIERNLRARVPEVTGVDRGSDQHSTRGMTMPATSSILVFGPHPDDQELGMGGTVAKLVGQGHRSTWWT